MRSSISGDGELADDCAGLAKLVEREPQGVRCAHLVVTVRANHQNVPDPGVRHERVQQFERARQEIGRGIR